MTVNVASTYAVKVSIILACKRRTEQQVTQGTIHPNAPPSAPIPPLGADTKWCRATTLVFRLEWSRQPSRAASHSHRAGRLPVTDMRRGSIPASQLLQRQRYTLAELRQQSVRRFAAGDPCAAEVRDGGGGGPRTLGSGIFNQAIAAYKETAKSTLGEDLCTTKTQQRETEE